MPTAIEHLNTGENVNGWHPSYGKVLLAQTLSRFMVHAAKVDATGSLV
jgi:hypothetical protein